MRTIFVIILMVALSGCKPARFIMSGNVYSSGYRDGYIIGTTQKQNGIAGYSFIGEIKVSFHGFGGGAVGNSENDALGAWRANYTEKDLTEKFAKIRGDQLVRIHYEELHYTLEDGTKYRVKSVEVLPSIEDMIDYKLPAK